jgi:hypothetical protein
VAEEGVIHLRSFQPTYAARYDDAERVVVHLGPGVDACTERFDTWLRIEVLPRFGRNWSGELVLTTDPYPRGQDG